MQSSYPPHMLYYANSDYDAVDVYDLSLRKGDVVGVIKKQDPMGSKNRWFVHNGAVQGFVPANILHQPHEPALPVSFAYQANPSPSVSQTRTAPQPPPIQINSQPSVQPSTSHISQIDSSSSSKPPFERQKSTPQLQTFPSNIPPPESVMIKHPRDQATLARHQWKLHPAPPPPLPKSTNSADMPVINGNGTAEVVEASNRYDEPPEEPETPPPDYSTVFGAIVPPSARGGAPASAASASNGSSTLGRSKPPAPPPPPGFLGNPNQNRTESPYQYALVDEFDPYAPLPSRSSSSMSTEVPIPLRNESHRYDEIPEPRESGARGTIVAPELEQKVEFWYAAYPFQSMGYNQLTLTLGQVVRVLQKSDMQGNEEWWLVQDRYSNRGYVPASYLAQYHSRP